MSYDPTDTICAIATAPGGAARGMVRMSGPDVLAIVDHLFQSDDGQQLDALQFASVVVGRVRISSNPPLSHPYQRGEIVVPCDLFLWPNSRSYTRQPVAELHTFGSPPLLQALLDRVCRAGARLAEPGEFTFRAFLAGRLDLTEAEAVLGVIDSHDADELNVALAQLAGGLARPLHQLRDDLLQLLAELEAGLDFVEEDIEFVSRDEVLDRLKSAAMLLSDVSQQMSSRSTATVAAQIALVGSPNVGKSSLFNALLARHGISTDAAGQRPTSPAIVSPRRGTTRDYLTAAINLGGRQCELVDTAGVDEAARDESAPHSDPHKDIESAAQAHSTERRNRAAIRILCIEASEYSERRTTGDRRYDVIALTKSDLTDERDLCWRVESQGLPVILTSSRTGQGLDDLSAACRLLLTNESAAQPGQAVSATAQRCRESIRLAAASLQTAIDLASGHDGDELLTAELRTALSELGKVVGAVYTDDLLDRIFSSFCIGK